MPQKRIPTPTQDAGNWGTILNDHLAQTQNPTNGAFNSFDQFSARPTNLTADDAGKTYLYTQTGSWHEWSGTEWKVLNKSEINVKDYGAIGDGVDDTTAIQFCLDKASVNKGTVYLPNGVYVISKPLEIASFVSFFDESMRGTVIIKNTIATGIGGFNSLIILKKEPDSYNSYCNIKNLFIGSDIKIDFGIVCEQGSAYLNISNLYIYNVKTGFKSNDSFLTSFTNSVISDTDAGIKILGGTSLVASDVYCAGSNVGFWLTNMVYSTLNSCAADNISYISYQITNCRGITLNSCGSEGLKGTASSIFYADNSFVTINAPFVIGDDAIMDKGVCFAANKSKLLVNNLCIDSIDSKFLYAESDSVITIDEINNFTTFVPTAFLPSNKYVEASGGKILTPTKSSSFVTLNLNYSNTTRAVNYNSAYPAGNNYYNENLNINLSDEINKSVGTNWTKAKITFQGNDFTNNSGYAVIQGFQTNGIKSFLLESHNAGAALVGDTLKIPTIAIAGGGHWYQMKGIYDITVGV